MSWYGCCKGTYVLLTLLDFLIGAVVTFLGLYPVLAWHGFPILDAVPFLAVGGLLILGAFLSSCGVCVRRHCGCCVTMSTPIVVLICVAEITLGILLFTKVPEKTLNTVKNAVNKDCDTSESGLFADELLEQAGDCDKSHQTTNDLIDRVKDGQKYIAYVMFGLAVLQLIRVYAGRVVRRIDYRRDNPSAQVRPRLAAARPCAYPSGAASARAPPRFH
jgi:hypothetical protein|eukprot:COSAG01_NODE_3743_length_5743_cov_10.259568_6_plen_218_part_00